LFREEQSIKDISPKKFQIRLKYQTPEERLAYAQDEAKVLLNNGKCSTTAKPFVFRAHEPLKHTTRGFQ